MGNAQLAAGWRRERPPAAYFGVGGPSWELRPIAPLSCEGPRVTTIRKRRVRRKKRSPLR